MPRLNLLPLPHLSCRPRNTLIRTMNDTVFQHPEKLKAARSPNQSPAKQQGGLNIDRLQTKNLNAINILRSQDSAYLFSQHSFSKSLMELMMMANVVECVDYSTVHASMWSEMKMSRTDRCGGGEKAGLLIEMPKGSIIGHVAALSFLIQLNPGLCALHWGNTKQGQSHWSCRMFFCSVHWFGCIA